MALVDRNDDSKRFLDDRNGNRSDAHYCSRTCTSPALTTIWSEPASCVNFWTPVTSNSYDYVEFTRNFTVDGCFPSLSTPPACRNCPFTEWSIAFSPGICPSDYPAAATIIYRDITTHYYCPRNTTGYTQIVNNNVATVMCSGNNTSGFLTIGYNASFISTQELIVVATPISWTSGYVTVTTGISLSIIIPAYTGKIYAEPLIVKFRSGDMTTSSSSTPTPQAGVST